MQRFMQRLGWMLSLAFILALVSPAAAQDGEDWVPVTVDNLDRLVEISQIGRGQLSGGAFSPDAPGSAPEPDFRRRVGLVTRIA